MRDVLEKVRKTSNESAGEGQESERVAREKRKNGFHARVATGAQTIVAFLQAPIDPSLAPEADGHQTQVAIPRERYRKSSETTKKNAILDERR